MEREEEEIEEDDIIVHSKPLEEEDHHEEDSNLHKTQMEELDLEPLAHQIVVPTSKKSFLSPTQSFLLQCLVYTCCIIPILFIILFFIIFYSYIVFVPFSIDYSQRESNYTSPKLKTGILTNGMRYVIRTNNENPIQQNRFSTYLHVPTGSSNEEDTERGIAHFCEHMAFDQSIDFPGRGGVWREIESAEIPSFNAFTSFRSTVYMLQDAMTGRMDTVFKILYNQVQGSQLLESAVTLERGAVLGEARLSNSTTFVSLSHLLSHHAGGVPWRAATRLPIGTQEILKSLTPLQIQNYFDTWYRLEKMTLYVVGDVDMLQIEKEIQQYWGSKRNRPSTLEPKENLPYGTPKGNSEILMEQLDHFQGIQLNLMMTEERLSHPLTLNQFRHYRLNRQLFSLSYGMLVLQAILSAYPSTDLTDLSSITQRMASAATQDFYMFNSTVSLMTFVSPEYPSLQIWKRDFAIYTQILQSIANNGVSSFYLYAFSFVLSIQMEEQALQMDQSTDNNQLLTLLLGEAEDPLYIPPYSQHYQWINQLSQVSMIPSIATDVQTMAQVLYSQFMNQIYGKELSLYSHLKQDSSQVSLSVFSDSKEWTSQELKLFFKTIHEQQQQQSTVIEGDSSNLYAQLVSGLTSGVSLQPKIPIALQPIPSTVIPTIIYSNPSLLFTSYQLSNGIRLHSKIIPHLTSDKTMYIEFVSLGGKSTLTPELHGACELISTGINLGYRYKDHINIATSAGSIMPKITCHWDKLILSTTINRDVFVRALEVLRLALRPWINPSSIAKASHMFMVPPQVYEDPLLQLEATIPHIWETVFPNDTRMHQVTAEQIIKLDAVKVQQWIDAQFTNDRMEINVVTKQSLSDAMLKEIQRWFGDIPSYPTHPTTVGMNIYSTVVPIPTLQFTFPPRTTCQVLTASDQRGAFVAAIYPYTSVSSNMAKDLFTRQLLRGYLFDEIRSKHGFGYFAIVSQFKSMVIPSFGYHIVKWAPGDYPHNVKDHFNIDTSLNVTQRVVQEQPVTEAIFRGVQHVVSSAVEMEMKKPLFWLEMMRGIGLKSVMNPSKMIRNVEQLDAANIIRQFRYEEFQNEYNQYEKGQVEIVVEPVTRNQFQKERAC